MKILIVQDYLRNGGTERQSVLLANGFAAAGHSCTLLTFRPGGPLAPTVSAGVNRVVLQTLDTGWDWYAPGLGRNARRVDPDIILCMGRMANCYGARLKGHCPRARLIGTLRTGKKLPALFRRTLALAEHIIANSEEAKSVLVTAHHLPRAKVSVIYNSLVFPPQNGAQRNDRLRREQGARPETVVLICVAMFRPEKNQRELVEIVSGLPATLDWQLWLAGEGQAMAPCQQLVIEKKLQDRVKFLGFLRDPSALYEAADIAVHASASESLSNFLIEAQSRGLPVVAYQAQGIRETFVPNLTGWEIARGDRVAFRARIEQLARQTVSAKTRRAETARHFARTTFDSEAQLTRYLGLLSSLVNPSMPT